MKSAKSFITKTTDDNNLCQKLTGLHNTSSNCFNHTIKQCFGACIDEEHFEDYNKRVANIIEYYRFENQNMVIIDRGRAVEERSAILIKNGTFIGCGFYNLNYQINNLEILQSIITPMEHNRDSQHIIQTYLRRKRNKLKIIKLETQHEKNS